MKLAIVSLCLFASVAWGQASHSDVHPDTTRVYIEPVGETYLMGPYWKWKCEDAAGRDAVPFSHVLRDSLVSWWDQYRAECQKKATRVDRDRENFGAKYPDLIWVEVEKDSIRLGMLDRTVWVDIGDGQRDCGFKTVVVPRYQMVGGNPTLEGYFEFLRRKK